MNEVWVRVAAASPNALRLKPGPRIILRASR